MKENKIETITEFLMAAYSELSDGRIRSAALLVYAGFKAIGLSDQKLETFKDLILKGYTPNVDKVEKLLKDLEKEIGSIEYPIIEINIKKPILLILGVILIAMTFSEILPPWSGLILIPLGVMCFIPLIIKI